MKCSLGALVIKSWNFQYVNEVHMDVDNAWMNEVAHEMDGELDSINHFIQPVLDRRENYVERNLKKKLRDNTEIWRDFLHGCFRFTFQKTNISGYTTYNLFMW